MKSKVLFLYDTGVGVSGVQFTLGKNARVFRINGWINAGESAGNIFVYVGYHTTTDGNLYRTIPSLYYGIAIKSVYTNWEEKMVPPIDIPDGKLTAQGKSAC